MEQVRAVVQDWCHKGICAGKSTAGDRPCITWTDVPPEQYGVCAECLGGLEDRGKYSPAALARERRELDRESRGLICHGTALLPVYLTGIGPPGQRLPPAFTSGGG